MDSRIHHRCRWWTEQGRLNRREAWVPHISLVFRETVGLSRGSMQLLQNGSIVMATVVLLTSAG